MDQQYSVTLGRPLGISSIGDCPSLMLLQPNALNSSLSNYTCQFSILARQILSAGYLCNVQIDQFTNQLLSLQEDLPDTLRFEEPWLHRPTGIPGWPLNAQAASLHQKTHNFLVLLNRQRIEEDCMDTLPDPDATAQRARVSPGRQRVLRSCNEILLAFQFFCTRVRVGLVCWTVCQQAFNAAIILIMEMIEHNNMEHYQTVCRTYDAFREMHQLGIHSLAGAAIEKIEIMINNSKSGSTPAEKVMSKQGMTLPEFVGERGNETSRFDPLQFDMVDVKTIAGDRNDTPNPERAECASGSAFKKQKQNLTAATVQKHKAAVKKAPRNTSLPQRRASSGPWVSENLHLNLVHAFSSPATSAHNKQRAGLSSLDIESTLNDASRTASKSSASDSLHRGLPATQTATDLHDMSEAKPWAYATRSSPTGAAFPATATSSISAPPSYHPASYMQNQHGLQYSHSTSLLDSRPPSLHIASHPSSSYANSFVSSLQTTSGLHTPSVSHPVSPSLSHSQQYCLSQPQTQPQSPVWGVGFDGTMECADLALGLGTNNNGCGGEGEGRTWWGQGWNS